MLGARCWVLGEYPIANSEFPFTDLTDSTDFSIFSEN